MIGKPCKAVWALGAALQGRGETVACLIARLPAAAIYSHRSGDIAGIKSLGILSEYLRVYGSMQDETGAASGRRSFDEVVLPHLDAAYNLARWLVRNPHDAEDVAQEAMTRAIKFFSGFRGGDPRAWLLTIVRNTCFTWLSRNHAKDLAEFDEETHSPGANPIAINAPGISSHGNQSSNP